MPNLRVPVNYTGGYTAADLITHIGKATTTLCACFYAVSELDGSVVAMTSYSSDLTSVPGYPGVTFKRNTGVTASQLQSDSGNAFSQMEATLFLVAAGITEADVNSGKWSHASAVLFICNYEALNMGQLVMQSGYLAEFVQKSPIVTSEIKGLNNALTAQIGKVTRPECWHNLGDSGCKIDLPGSGFIHTATLSAVTSQTVFRAASLAGTGDAEYYNNGIVRFTSGNNNNYFFRVDSWNDSTGEFTLRTPTPYLPTTSDTISATRGCQKRPGADCRDRFSNITNFGGFSTIPTYESFSRLPAGASV